MTFDADKTRVIELTYGETRSSAVAKRPRDASCHSVVSFNSTKRRVESFIVSYCVQLYALFRCLWRNAEAYCHKDFVVFSGPSGEATERGVGGFEPPIFLCGHSGHLCRTDEKMWGYPRNVVLGETSCNIFRKPMILVSCLIIYSNTAVE